MAGTPRATASRGGVLDARVTVVGLTESAAILRQLNPKVLRTLNRRLRKVALEVAKDAAGLAPTRTGQMASGYRVKRGKVRSSTAQGYSVINETPQGAILEFAGAASPGLTDQGASLIEGLDQRYGPTGRFIWEAYDSKAEQHFRTLASVVDEIEAEAQRALNARGGAR